MPVPPASNSAALAAPTRPTEPPLDAALPRWQRWWRRLSPTRQDRLAALAPLVAVLMFLASIAASFWYLRSEEIDREQEALKRDTEYAQQRLNLRMAERQEQVMRLARDLAEQRIERTEFDSLAEMLVNQYPELQALSWIDAEQRVRASQTGPSLASSQMRINGEILKPSEEAYQLFALARERGLPQYRLPPVQPDEPAPLLQLHVPLQNKNRFDGVLLAEYSLDNLLRYITPVEVISRYAVTLIDSQGQVLAGSALPAEPRRWLPWSQRSNTYQTPLLPPDKTIYLRAQAYRTSLGVIGSGLFWLVSVLSAMTTWMLMANWRHTRRRMQAQRALVAETNFRRAMENSVLTGMRALDLQGRITYVNAAFCQMTGFSPEELVGQMPPYSYWPESEHAHLTLKLQEELSGKVAPGGFQVRVQRKTGLLFDARLYVSPLIDARGQHTGWMTSMTDITEPNRVREQLTASHERFTIVLEALDASVSVAPLGSQELLFANRLYRQWFGSQTAGHLHMVAQAGLLRAEDYGSRAQGGAGNAAPHSKNAEIYLPELGKWLEVRSRYLSWVDGRLAQMVIATDITPRRLAEEQAARQTERAQSVSRLITMGEMASSVAHELNQPLTAINNYCSGMMSRIQNGNLSQEALLGALEKTAHQAQRAGQIIQRIRSFVKKSTPNRQLAQVEQMVAEAVVLADIELRRHNVRLSHYVAARLPAVMADSILIEQVLINLMKNAAESIAQAERPPGQRSVELRVVPRQLDDKDGIEFSVSDTGKGLPEQVLEHLFEAFYSTKSEGMGIGLNLCRSIIESHQGRLQAENLYNANDLAGCRFSFWLPLA